MQTLNIWIYPPRNWDKKKQQSFCKDLPRYIPTATVYGVYISHHCSYVTLEPAVCIQTFYNIHLIFHKENINTFLKSILSPLYDNEVCYWAWYFVLKLTIVSLLASTESSTATWACNTQLGLPNDEIEILSSGSW